MKKTSQNLNLSSKSTSTQPSTKKDRIELRAFKEAFPLELISTESRRNQRQNSKDVKVIKRVTSFSISEKLNLKSLLRMAKTENIFENTEIYHGECLSTRARFDRIDRVGSSTNSCDNYNKENLYKIDREDKSMFVIDIDNIEKNNILDDDVISVLHSNSNINSSINSSISNINSSISNSNINNTSNNINNNSNIYNTNNINSNIYNTNNTYSNLNTNITNNTITNNTNINTTSVPIESIKSIEGNIFFFEYGVIVMWGFDEIQEASIINLCKAYLTRPYPANRIEFETLHYTISSEAFFCSDVFHLTSEDHFNKMIISHGLAQSVKLDYFETLVEETIDSVAYLPYELEKFGHLKTSKKVILSLIGKIHIIRFDLNLVSNILDSPEVLWFYAEFEKLYHAVSKCMDIKNRTDLLNKRIDTIQSFLMVGERDKRNEGSNMLLFQVLVLIFIACFIVFAFFYYKSLS